MKYILGQPIAYAIVVVERMLLKTFQEYIHGTVQAFASLWLFRRRTVCLTCMCSTGGRNNTDRHLWRWKQSKERVLDIKTKIVYLLIEMIAGNRSWYGRHCIYHLRRRVLKKSFREHRQGIIMPFIIYMFILCFQTDKNLKNTIELEKYQMMHYDNCK